ncbi:MAG: hypothetical protein AAFV86_07070 [Pseudomonadota bacterium]
MVIGGDRRARAGAGIFIVRNPDKLARLDGMLVEVEATAVTGAR